MFFIVLFAFFALPLDAHIFSKPVQTSQRLECEVSEDKNQNPSIEVIGEEHNSPKAIKRRNESAADNKVIVLSEGLLFKANAKGNAIPATSGSSDYGIEDADSQVIASLAVGTFGLQKAIKEKDRHLHLKLQFAVNSIAAGINNSSLLKKSLVMLKKSSLSAEEREILGAFEGKKVSLEPRLLHSVLLKFLSKTVEYAQTLTGFPPLDVERNLSADLQKNELSKESADKLIVGLRNNSFLKNILKNYCSVYKEAQAQGKRVVVFVGKMHEKELRRLLRAATLGKVSVD